MSEPVTYPAPVVDLSPPPLTKWAREYRAFLQMLPALLQTHRDQYVAIHEGQVVDSGNDKIALALRVYAKYGYLPICVGLVAERPPAPVRIPSFRVLEEISPP